MSTAHPLDRPAWCALTSRQASLSLGDGRALRFDPDYAAFAAAADLSMDSQAALTGLIGEGRVFLMEAGEDPAPTPPGAEQVLTADCVQMTADALTPGGAAGFDILDLADADGSEMLALATLTEPGPFFARTHQLGDFVGVRQDGRLVAMAGERQKMEGFTEVSGVCTHPDWRGRGYARALMRVVAGRILDRGETASCTPMPRTPAPSRFMKASDSACAHP